MANPEHVKILKQGVEVWNRWREENLNVVPDLSGASLSGIKFKRANFTGTNFRRAKLIDADISRADLNRTDFSEADLRGANLLGSNLNGADLSEARLFGANLAGAHLNGVDFTDTKLFGAILIGAQLNKTDLSEADLSEVVDMPPSGNNKNDSRKSNNIEMDKNVDPSSLGIDVTYKPKRKISEALLRGCGVPVKIIKKIRHLFERDDQHHSCFISYSHADEKFVHKLHKDLKSYGINCWYATKDIKSGKKIHEQLEDAIGKHERLLLVLSDASMDSPWVKTEIANARKLKTRLHPISIVHFENIRNWKQFDADIGGDTAKELREYFIPDFSGWQNPDTYKKALEKLIEDLKSES